MPPSTKPKILIVFPSPPGDSANHYPYWHKLFTAAGSDLNLVYLYENQHSRIGRLRLMWRYIRKGYCKVYCHYGYLSVYMARCISLFLPVKIYLWDCEYYDKKPDNRLLPLALRLTDVLVTGSKTIGEQYRKIFNLGSKPIMIVPNYVEEDANTHEVPLKIKNSKLKILYLHHLSPRKGSREVPEIIRLTLEKIPTAHFHIVGNGPDCDYVRSSTFEVLRSTQHIEPSTVVTFHNSLPHSQAIQLFKSCDYFIMPSRAEGFPRVILEAMLYKIPFVATHVGNVAEIVSPLQMPFIVPPKKADVFTSALIRLIRENNNNELIKANYERVTSMYSLIRAKQAFISLFI